MPATERRPSVPSDIEALGPSEVLELALRALGPDRLALASSFGPEDMVLTDLLCRLEASPRIFTLDTGRLPQETYDLMDATRRQYGLRIEVMFPDAFSVEDLVRGRGLNLMYESVENRRDCCRIRKVEPLTRALSTVDGWITGLRRDQITTRSDTAKIALDERHDGIWKVAPLADWTRDEVWGYIREHDLPYNALHDKGYASIGCDPCSRAIQPGEDERAGRWWWEEPATRECGLHFDPQNGRLIPPRPRIVPPEPDAGVGREAASF